MPLNKITPESYNNNIIEKKIFDPKLILKKKKIVQFPHAHHKKLSWSSKNLKRNTRLDVAISLDGHTI